MTGRHPRVGGDPGRQLCRGGGIGRHPSFRYLWGKPRGGSSPLLGTIFLF
jgi:hypothetical protein